MKPNLHLLLTVGLFGLLVVACQDREFDEFCQRRQVHPDLRSLVLPAQARYVLYDSTGMDSIVVEVISMNEQKDCGNNDRQGSYQLVVYSYFAMRVLSSNNSLFNTIFLSTKGEGCLDRDCFVSIGVSDSTGLGTMFSSYFAINSDSIRISQNYRDKPVVMLYENYRKLVLASEDSTFIFGFVSGKFLDHFCFNSLCFYQR